MGESLSAVRRNNPEIAGTLIELMDGEIASEDKPARVFDLLQGIVTTEIDGARSFRENIGPTTQVQSER
jgi:hypothetical protein